MATKKNIGSTSDKPSLMERMQKACTIKEAAVFSESKFFEADPPILTTIPAVNLALSGTLKGGYDAGLIVWAGPSKHFKTLFTLMMLKAYFDRYADAIAIWYDSEFGSPQAYFDAYGIDTSRVLHVPLTNIEELKFDIVKQLEEIKRGDHVFIGFDSAGNLASKKEVEDALEGKSTADMTRAKQLKSLFRMVTPHLKIKKIPMVVVNHTYQCGTEDMTVRTPDRGAVSLKDIRVGDFVETVNGPEQVSFTTVGEDAFVTDIEMEDGSVLSFTAGHRFMVNGKWKYVEDLKAGDDIDTV